MTSRPGMADARAFGLDPYRPVGQLDDDIMRQNKISSYQQYRAFLDTQGNQLMAKFKEQARKNADRFDRGCGMMNHR
jgi:hypothetical protein